MESLEVTEMDGPVDNLSRPHNKNENFCRKLSSIDALTVQNVDSI